MNEQDRYIDKKTQQIFITRIVADFIVPISLTLIREAVVVALIFDLLPTLLHFFTYYATTLKTFHVNYCIHVCFSARIW